MCVWHYGTERKGGDWVHVVACPAVIAHGVSEKARGRSRELCFRGSSFFSFSPFVDSLFLFYRILGWRGWTHVNFILFQRLVIRWEKRNENRIPGDHFVNRIPGSFPSASASLFSFSRFWEPEDNDSICSDPFLLSSAGCRKRGRNQESAEASWKIGTEKTKRLREWGKD